MEMRKGGGASDVNKLDLVATNGVLLGTAKTNSLIYIYKSDRFFYGSTVPEVRIRLRADANCKVDLYWTTPTADAYAGVRSMYGYYTNNGAFQDIVFSLAGNTNWDGQAITRLRFSPWVHTNTAGRGFAIDSITVPKETHRVKGLRFRSANPYTLSGGGQLRIQANNSTSTVDVLQGKHTNDVALILGSSTAMNLTNNTSLHLKQGVNLNGKTLHVTGTGRLLLQGALVLGGGTLAVNGTTPIAFTNNLMGTALNGTLQLLPEGAFAATNGTSFNLLDNESLLGANRFTQVSLPALPAGLQWNTSTLYSNGNVFVEAIPHSLIVTTSYGNAIPAAGTNTYNYGTSLTVVLTNSPVLNGVTTQYVCRGWTGTGNAPASGTSTNTGGFTLTTNSTVTWIWATNYWLDTAATTGGSVNVAGGWKTSGDNVQVTAVANTYYHFAGWFGDAATNTDQITLVMSRARAVMANFAPNVTTNTGTPEQWLAQYGLTNYNADALADTDHDGLLTWQEYIAGTNPTNPASNFVISTVGTTPQGAIVVRWSSMSNRFYSLSRATNLLEAFTVIAGASNLPATPPENVFTSPADDGDSSFYRINVHE